MHKNKIYFYYFIKTIKLFHRNYLIEITQKIFYY